LSLSSAVECGIKIRERFTVYFQLFFSLTVDRYLCISTRRLTSGLIDDPAQGTSFPGLHKGMVDS